MLLLLVRAALAQSCSCSVGATDTSLPMGTVLDAGAVVVGLDYTLGQTGGETWEGVVAAKDLQGDSMGGMAMPGHLAQAGRLTASIGAPAGFSATAVVPYIHSAPLYPSEMPGDVPRSFAGDASIGARWGVRREGTFAGVGLTATLPTGQVIRGVGVRGGRGALGGVVDASALQMVGPVLGIAGRASWAQGFYASPIDDYLVAPQLDLALGARAWTREQGRLSLTGLVAFLHKGHDRAADFELDQTGLDVLSTGAGADWRVWADKRRSLLLSLRGQAPVWQVVGDRWLAENFTLSTGAALSF